MNGDYDERNLGICQCGCGRKFPTKKMFYDFLKDNYNDIDADVNILLVDRGRRQKIIVELEWEYPQ